MSIARSDLAETAESVEPRELGVVGFAHVVVGDASVEARFAASLVAFGCAAGDAPKWKTPAATGAAGVFGSCFGFGPHRLRCLMKSLIFE